MWFGVLFLHIQLCCMNLIISSNFIWILLSSWSETSPNQYVLSANSAGLYEIEAQLESSTPEFTTSLNWNQDLNGSNNNYSELFLAFECYDSSSETLEADTVFIRAGETGADDPLRVHTHSGGEIFSTTSSYLGLSSFGSPFETIITAKKDSASNTLQLHITNTTQNYTLPLCSIELQSHCYSLKGVGLKAKCTSSNTENFSFGVSSFSQSYTSNIPLYLNSHFLSASAELNLFFNQRITQPLSLKWTSSNDTIQNTTPEAGLNSICLDLPYHQLRPGIPREITLTSHALDTTISVVLTTTSPPSFRDIVFTEIMADATPSMSSIPEDEYIEIYNCSNTVIDVNGWVLIDSDTPYPITHNWDGLLYPESTFIIVRTPSLWANFSANKSECSSWSGLNDNGDHLQLVHPSGIAVDILEYEKSWWQEGTSNTQPGRSLSKIHSRSCNISSSWFPTSLPNGSSPGIYTHSDTIYQTPQVVTPHKINDEQICLDFSPPIDPTSSLKVRTSESLWTSATFLNDYWKVDIPVDDRRSIFIEIDSIRSCQNSRILNTLLEYWTVVEPVNSSNIAISEICHSPLEGGSEWIELTKTTENSIDLFDLHINGVSIYNELFESNKIFESIILLQSEHPEWNSLNATEGEIILTHGIDTLEQVNYNKCWHTNNDCFYSGSTLQRIDLFKDSNDPGNWGSSRGIWGGSPNEYQTTEKEVIETGIVWAMKDNKLSWKSSVQMDSTVLNPYNWSFQLGWEFDDATQTSATSIETIEWISYWADSIYLLDRPNQFKLTHINSLLEDNSGSRLILNELLPEPNTQACRFIELKNPSEHTAFANDYLLTSTENPNAEDWTRLSNEAWIIPPGELIALAECPSWIEHIDSQSICIESDLPSLQKGRELILSKDYELTCDAYTIPACQPGISQERICTDLELWVDAPSPFATPGRENTSSCDLGIEKEGVHFSVWPKTIHRSNENFRWINVEYHDLISAIFNVYSIQGELVFIHELDERKRIIWEGIDANGFNLNAGNYVIELYGITEGGNEAIERELVVILE